MTFDDGGSIQIPASLLFEATATASFQFVCVFLVSTFIVFCCIPRLHSSVRELVRPSVLFWVERGIDWNVWAQQYKRPWLTNLFEQSSHSVSVGFYGSFLPCVIWLGLPELGWHLVVLMTLTLYVGNAMKDLVCAPRPLGIPYGKSRLSLLGSTTSEEINLNANEYGLPSSHTMNSLCLNFYAVHYLHEVGLLSDSRAVLAYFLVMLWVIWIAASRIYLGLHTPVDIGAGAIAGLTVVTTFISLEGVFNAWVQQSRMVVLSSAALASLVLLRLHPRPLEPTPSFEFTTSFMGVMFGVVVGVNRYPAFFLPPVTVAVIQTQSWVWIVRRLLTGFTLVLASKEISRAVAFAVLPQLYLFFPGQLRRLWQPPVHNQYEFSAESGKYIDPGLKGLPHSPRGRPYDVEFTSRFFAYAGIGFAACGLAPQLLTALDW